MKILMVNKFLYPNGGSETYIFKLGEQLIKMGHEVQYFGMEHEGRIVGNAINCYTKNMDFYTGKLEKILYPFKIIYSREAAQKITQVLKSFTPDIVHINNFNFQLTPSIIYAIRKFEKSSNYKIKIVYTAHDYQWVCPNHMLMIPSNKELCTRCEGGHYANCIRHRCVHNSLVKSILGAIEGKLYFLLGTYKKVDAIICPSEFLKKKLENYKGIADKLIALHNFEDKKVDTSNSESKLEYKVGSITNNITENTTDYVLYFGRYSEEKGVRTLLNVCKKLPEISFVFAGGGPLEDEVNSVANIKNLGFLSGEKLYGTIRNAKFVVFASEWYENCPFSVMEAISFGTPVIGTSIGGVPELISNNVNGLLYESGNAEELKNKVEFLWNNREDVLRLREGCKETEFDSLVTYCARLIKIYK